MRPGVRIGVDFGAVRIGVARSDPAGVLATPLRTVRRGPGDVAELAALVGAEQAMEVIVGLPRSLSGRAGPAERLARAFAADLARALPVPVRLVDERFSTVAAQAGFRAQGVSTRRSRSRVDQAAAAVILQNALDNERERGAPPGEEVAAS